MSEHKIYGRVAVTEALKAGRPFEKIYLQKPPYTGSIVPIVREAKKRHIPISLCDSSRLSELSEGGVHQGVVALVSPVSFVTVDDILSKAQEKGEMPFILVLESIQDPRNLGAILRTAECAGVHGVVMSKHHAAPLTDACAKTAAGALEYVPIAMVSSTANLIEDLKKRGIWTACADMDGENLYQADLKGPLALVIGGEHEGITRLVKERCDFSLSLPMKGHITSLNASVAAALFMYEVVRQRQ